MLKVLLSKWGILTIVALVSIATAVSVAVLIPKVENTEVVYNKAEYVLVNEAGERLYSQNFEITNANLEEGVYTNKIYLKKVSKENAYLRMFVNISKKTEEGVPSIDDNELNIPYEVSFTNFVDGESVAEDDGDSSISNDVNFCWKYYNQKVENNNVELFNEISFRNGIEEGCKYVVNIQIELVNESEISTTSWQYEAISKMEFSN